MTPWHPIFKLASPQGPGARLSTLIFHRVLAEPDPIFPDEMHAQRFDEVCGWLKSWFNVLPLDTAVRQLSNGSLPERACCITFDDGYADNLQIAAPILQKHALSATFFIATGFLDGGRMWNDTVIESIRYCTSPLLVLDSLGLGRFPLVTISDRRAAIDSLLGQIKYLLVEERRELTERIAQQAGVEPPQDLMLGVDGVRALRQGGMQIGAHTVSHPILARLSASQARDEMLASQLYLQDVLGERVGLFAYPNGKPGTDYLAEHAGIAREVGFDAAVSTAWGVANAATDCFQLPRFTPWDRSSTRFGLRMLRNMRQHQA